MVVVEKSGSLAGAMSRSLDRGNGACRAVLDRAQLLTSVVKWDELHALLFGPRSLLPESVETEVKRNIITRYVRRVSLWTVCDELLQEWLNNLQEIVDSEDLTLCVEIQSESRVRCVGACLNSVLGSSGGRACCGDSNFGRFFQSSEMCLQSILFRRLGVM